MYRIRLWCRSVHCRLLIKPVCLNQLPDCFTIFSRSYCYTAWSAIGIINVVCPSCPSPSVCNAEYCVSQGLCTGPKVVYKRVSSGHVPICPFWHFCCRMYRLAIKRTGIKTSRRKCEREFLYCQAETLWSQRIALKSSTALCRST